MIRKTCVLVGVVGIASLLACGSSAKPPPSPPSSGAADGGLSEDVAQRKILHRKDITDFPNKELIAVSVTVPPHATLGKVTQAGQGFVYIVSGALQFAFDGEEPRTVNSGETLATRTDKPVEVKNLGMEPSKVVTIMIVNKGGGVVAAPSGK
jgi:quercetin dioxygenase-like cupin family protein